MSSCHALIAQRPPAAPASMSRRFDRSTLITMTPAPELEDARPARALPGHMLPLGSRLRDYEITGLLGEGTCSIVYLGWDHSLQRKVAVKEYMPGAIAARVTGSAAIVAPERHFDTFKTGLNSFLNEARLLARFDHPSLVKVYRFWEENGTAYMVMPYYEGPTLKTALAELGHVPSEDELRLWLRPLLDALTVMHAAQCFHRDIAPDNILLTASGPLLLDFGAARRVIGDMTHAITVVLKPGYAPIEQYGDVASMSQGAWTDLYALACVVYYAITGKTPMSSVERLMDDRLEPLAVTAAGHYSPAFLRAIDAALAVRPGDRPQSERQFRALLDADRPATVDFSRSLSGREDSGWQPSAYPTVPDTLQPETQIQARPVPPMPPAGVVTTMPMASLAAMEPTVVAPIARAVPAAVAAPVAPLAAAHPGAAFAATAVETAAPPRASVRAAAPAATRTGIGALLALLIGLAAVGAAIFWWQRGAEKTAPPAPRAAASAIAATPSASRTVALPAPMASAAVVAASAATAPGVAASSVTLPMAIERPLPSAASAIAPAAPPVVEPGIEAAVPPAETNRPPVARDPGAAVPSGLPAPTRSRRDPPAP